jgi:hypothetical protein
MLPKPGAAAPLETGPSSPKFEALRSVDVFPAPGTLICQEMGRSSELNCALHSQYEVLSTKSFGCACQALEGVKIHLILQETHYIEHR